MSEITKREAASLDDRMIKLHTELRALREIVEVIRKETIKQAKRIEALETRNET